jgi:hypothetical protein
MHIRRTLEMTMLAFCLIGSIGGCGGGDPQNPSAAFTLTTELRTDGTLVRVDASGCSDLQENVDLLEVRWDWDGDTVFDTPYRTTKTAEYLYRTPGQRTLVLEVKDSTGYCGQYRATIAVTPRLTVTPPQTTLSIKEDTRFTATVMGCEDHRVTWATTGGTVTEGQFTAPASAGTCRITATSVADPTVAAHATVAVVAGEVEVEVQ